MNTVSSISTAAQSFAAQAAQEAPALLQRIATVARSFIAQIGTWAGTAAHFCTTDLGPMIQATAFRVGMFFAGACHSIKTFFQPVGAKVAQVAPQCLAAIGAFFLAIPAFVALHPILVTAIGASVVGLAIGIGLVLGIQKLIAVYAQHKAAAATAPAAAEVPKP